MRLLTIATILLTVWPVPGADSASLRFMGFSPDGECFALEQVPLISDIR